MIRENITLSLGTKTKEDIYVCRLSNGYHVSVNSPVPSLKNKYNIKAAYRFDVTYPSDMFPEILKQTNSDFTLTTNDGLILIKYGSKYVLYDLIISNDNISYDDIDTTTKSDLKHSNKVYLLTPDPFTLSSKTIRFVKNTDNKLFHKLKILKIFSDKILVNSDYEFIGSNITLYTDINTAGVDKGFTITDNGLYLINVIIPSGSTEYYVEIDNFIYKPHYRIQFSNTNDFTNSTIYVKYTAPVQNLNTISMSGVLNTILTILGSDNSKIMMRIT